MDLNKAKLIATDFIKQWEGLSLKAYSDQGGKITIGYGHTGGIEFGTQISEEQAIKFLEEDLTIAIERTLQLVLVPLTNNQLAALASFVFNLGPNNLKRSGLLKMLNMKKYREAADQFPLWCHIGLYVSQGLLNRRNAEKALFLKEDT